MVVVDSDPHQQLARAALRDGNSRAQIQRIIDAQLPRSERLARADLVVDNRTGAAELALRVEQLHQQLSARSRAAKQENRS